MKMISIKVLPALLITGMLAGCGGGNGAQPQHKNIIDAVFASGSITTENEYDATANMEGYISKSYVLEGDSVNAGQSLFRLSNDVQQTQVDNALANYRYARADDAANSPKIQQLQLQIKQAEDKLATDSVNYARYASLVKTKAVSRVDYDNARLTYQNSRNNLGVLRQSLADTKRSLALNVENTKAQLEIQKQNNNYYDLKAVATGKVMQIFRKDGDYVKKGDMIAKIGTGKIVARLLIAEEDIQRVKTGQKTYISLNSERDNLLPACISKIYPSFDQTDQAFTADATFDKVPAGIKDGTQLQANIIISQKSNALVIPTQYLLPGDSVLLKNGKKKIHVQTGIRTLEYTEITGGLPADATIILPK